MNKQRKKRTPIATAGELFQYFAMLSVSRQNELFCKSMTLTELKKVLRKDHLGGLHKYDDTSFEAVVGVLQRQLTSVQKKQRRRAPEKRADIIQPYFRHVKALSETADAKWTGIAEVMRQTYGIAMTPKQMQDAYLTCEKRLKERQTEDEELAALIAETSSLDEPSVFEDPEPTKETPKMSPGLGQPKRPAVPKLGN